MARTGSSSSKEHIRGNENQYYDTNPYEEGSIYFDMWNNNPYADLYYEPTFWDTIGLSNKAKDANMNYQQLYNEYIAKIAELKASNEYNSPANQALLEKQAGLNPSLTGISGVGAMSQSSSPNGGANPALNGESPSKNALGIITSVLGFATSTMQQLKAIQGLSLDNTSKMIGNYDSLSSSLIPIINGEYANRFSGKTANDWSTLSKLTADSMGFTSRSAQRRFDKAFNSILNSSRYTSSQKAYETLNDNQRAMNTFIGGLVDLEVQMQKHNYKGSISQAIYNKDFYDNLDGKSAAEAQNRINSNTGWLDKWRNEYYNRLYKDWKNNGNILSALLLIGLGGDVIGAGGNLINSLFKLPIKK